MTTVSRLSTVSAGSVTAAEIAAVIARPDRIQRNQGVTQIYHRLAVALVERLGRPDLTWCAFATWASATAGGMIAMRELPPLFRRLLGESDDYHKHLPHVRHVLDENAFFRAAEVVAGQVSDALSDGNTLVFSELAPAFVALLDGRPLPADPTAGEAGPLVEPFARYRRALSDPDPVRSAQDILAANVLAVYHEQQRLQPYIVAALDASLRDVFHDLTEHRLTGRLATDLGPHLEPLLKAVDDAWDEALTRHASTLITPGQVFHLGRDVPPLADGSLWPAALAQLSAPDPSDVIARFDRSHGTLVGSAAADWAVLEDRMNYIVNLFRSRQQDATLLQPPELTIDLPGDPAARS
jgi:hypothetical protein